MPPHAIAKREFPPPFPIWISFIYLAISPFFLFFLFILGVSHARFGSLACRLPQALATRSVFPLSFYLRITSSRILCSSLLLLSSGDAGSLARNAPDGLATARGALLNALSPEGLTSRLVQMVGITGLPKGAFPCAQSGQIGGAG
jgi:hypothetical protein